MKVNLCKQCEAPLIRRDNEAIFSFLKRQFCNNSHARKWEFRNNPKLQKLRQESLNKISKARSDALWSDGKKICSNCREYLPPTSEYFSPQKEMTRHLASWCKKCKREQMREKGQHLSRTTNGSWTAQDKKDAFGKQEGKCAICGKDLIYWYKAHADHIHNTSLKRELLCQHCNHLLGSAFDNLNILQSAIHYLQKHSIALSL